MFLDYLIRLTVLSLHHGYTLYISHDYCLYYISFVYLKSFKELFLISKLSFVSENVCKGKRFFLNHQIFSKFFSKKIFGKFSEGVRLILSRSLAHPQGKILGAAFGTLPRSLKLHSVCHLQRLSLSKAVAKVRTFFIHATFTAHFFAKFFQVLV